MRIKITLLTLLALGVGLIWNFSGTEEEIVANYSTRDSRTKMTSAEGWYETMKALKGNLETGEIEPEDHLQMVQAVKAHNKSTGNQKAMNLGWKELGPDNMGGRTRAIVVVDEQTYFAGSVSGGLYRTDNGANSWYKVPNVPFSIIGSMAMTGNGDLYVGTGSQFDGSGGGNGGSEFAGNGLWRSTDMGETWEVIDGTEPPLLTSSGDWTAINSLEADPLQDDKVWIAGDAGVGYYVAGSDDLVMNAAAADGLGGGSGQDIAMSNDGSVYMVAISGDAYISYDQGQSFESLTGSGGLPGSMRRCRVEVAAEDSDYCYALFCTNAGFMGGAYYSTDMGNTWASNWPGGIPDIDPMGTNGQGYYDLALGVDPDNPAKAYVGGVDLYEFGSVITPAEIGFIPTSFFFSVHPDHHEFKNTPDGKILACNDGGVYISEDNGSTWYDANRGYNVAQFYGIGISSGDAVAGGTQDNSTIVIPRDGSLNTLEEGFQIIGGDGFYTELSQATGGTNMVIGTSQYGIFERYDENGGGGAFYDINMLNQALDGNFQAGGFYTCIALFEDTQDEDSQQFTIVANPEDYDITDTTLTVYTNNLNIPFDYVLEDGDVLHFWDEIERPAIVTTEPLTEDPNYWWLDVQLLDSIVEVCDLDSSYVETISVPVDSIPVTLCDTIFSEVLEIDVIICDTVDYDVIFGDVDVYDYFESCYDEYYYAADVVGNVREQRRIVDPYTSMFVIGFSGTDGIWLTRQALNFSVTPHWYRIVDTAPGGSVKRFEFTQDGNHLFYSGWSGSSLYRVSNLDSLWTAGFDSDGNESYIGGDVDSLDITVPYNGAGGTITGIACDPNNVNHVVISIGGYGTVTQGKLQETWNALDETPTWENVWFPNSDVLARMPLYDVLIDATDDSGQSIIVGSEFGIYTTDNGGDDWAQENDPAEGEWTTGVGQTPVFEVRQQKILEPMMFREPSNSGVIYAGTHGRGIFASYTKHVVNVEENDDYAEEAKEDMMTVYPNPVSSTATLEFDLRANQDVIINIYSIHGELIESIAQDNLPAGTRQIQLDVSDYARGNYLIHLDAGNSSKVGRFVKF